MSLAEELSRSYWDVFHGRQCGLKIVTLLQRRVALVCVWVDRKRPRLAAGSSPGQTTDNGITVLFVLFTRLRLPALKSLYVETGFPSAPEPPAASPRRGSGGVKRQRKGLGRRVTG